MEVAEIDAEEQQLRDLGRETDLAEGRGEQPPVSATPKAGERAPAEAKPPQSQPPATGEPEKKPVSSETEPSGEQKPPQQQKTPPRDLKTGQFQRQEAPAGENGKETPESRAQREQQRRDESWRALNEQKEAFRREQAQWNEQVRISQLQQQRTAPPIEKDGLNIKGYWDGYQLFKRNAISAFRNQDFEAAVDHYDKSLRSLEAVFELNQQEQMRQAQRDHAQAEYAWRMDMEAAGRQNPDLFNPDNPLAQKVDSLVQQHPWLYYIPHGFLRAVEVAQMLSQQDSLSELQDENEQLRAQLEQALGNSQPLPGGAQRPPKGKKSLDEMSMEEADAAMAELTRQADEEARY
jgi:hypothetical protein